MAFQVFPGRGLRAILAGLMICSTADAALSTRYALNVLPTLGGNGAYAYAVNNQGQVVGEAQRSDGLYHAVMWNSQGQIQDLGHLGYNRSAAFGINDLGQIVGRSYLAEGDPHAFVWTAAAGMKDLGTLGGTSSLAAGVNNRGVMVGQADVLLPDWSTRFRAVRWTSSTSGPMTLSTLAGKYSHAAAINDSGQIAGYAYNTLGMARAVRWSAAGLIQDLGTFGGARSWSTAINSLGYVVGRAEIANGNTRAFFWNGITKVNLGTLGGANSSATSINNLGDIVGVSEIGTPNETRGFAWSAGKGMLDLNNLIVPGSGWTITSVNDINDLGVIVGWATNGQGIYRAVALTPVMPGDFNSDRLINIQDINPFVTALSDQINHQQSSPYSLAAVGDLNGDGQFSVQDINPFLEVIAISQGGAMSLTTAIPEPATPVWLLAAGMVGWSLSRSEQQRRRRVHALSFRRVHDLSAR